MVSYETVNWYTRKRQTEFALRAGMIYCKVWLNSLESVCPCLASKPPPPQPFSTPYPTLATCKRETRRYLGFFHLRRWYNFPSPTSPTSNPNIFFHSNAKLHAVKLKTAEQCTFIGPSIHHPPCTKCSLNLIPIPHAASFYFILCWEFIWYIYVPVECWTIYPFLSITQCNFTFFNHRRFNHFFFNLWHVSVFKT